MGEYDDIIDLERPVSKTHPPMPYEMRAAQFSPFAALTTLSGAVSETARTTEEKAEIGDESKAELDAAIKNLMERVKERPEVTVTYFIADMKKNGGMYIAEKVKVKRVDTYNRLIITEERKIPFGDIREIEL